MNVAASFVLTHFHSLATNMPMSVWIVDAQVEPVGISVSPYGIHGLPEFLAAGGRI
jgi:hypothetical protein